ncbi:hypothetical protein [Nocardia sp. CNY236]|uniref:hypothetical protein n=1 Tax=Nocardia sp. CNY236 TaxID=1169152 RepID=UPI0018C9AB0A|nr:hypothetical protein [Nocardia sp. CNY236]
MQTTMPNQALAELGQTVTRPLSLRAPVCTAAPVSETTAWMSPEGVGGSDLQSRLIAANQRAAELEEQLAAVVAARDAAEHHAAQLEHRNQELASDLDNALDQLAGHALHAEQERLIRTPVWSPWSACSDREGLDR